MFIQHPMYVDIFSLCPQTFKVFEKLADQDRERQLLELQKRQESRSVPPAVQELEVTAESSEGMEEQSVEAPQTAGPTQAAAAGDASTVRADASSSGDSCSSLALEPQGNQTAAAAVAAAAASAPTEE